MFIVDDERTGFPIKIWLQGESHIEAENLQQAIHLSHLPFLHKWVALMPDTHLGMGMPIGGVIALKDAIIPNAVGVDIGCGMGFVGTNISVKMLLSIETGAGNILEAITGDIMRNIPLGFRSHKNPQDSQVLDTAKQNMHLYEEEALQGFIQKGYNQVGTLGGGNHFIELQKDQDGKLGIMVHSGSRNFGKQICDYFNKVAREEAATFGSKVPDSYRLAYLPTDSKAGKSYIRWMNLALDYAKENRQKMMESVIETLERWLLKYLDLDIVYDEIINCHHNYASLEEHFGEQVWVHRKGATQATLDEKAVIPGAMGSYSYVVRGLGNKESFNSCSHGAGRKYSRTQAKREFSAQTVLEDLKEKKVILGKINKKDVAEEARFAYKNIEEVMADQKDLVEIVKTLETVAVVKG